MAKRTKRTPAATLSEACLAIREFLWDGKCPYADVFPVQESCICLAASKAKKAHCITLEQRDMIQHIVQSRLGSYSFVTRYVIEVHGANKPSAQAIQDYRHAWLIELSKEFSNV